MLDVSKVITITLGDAIVWACMISMLTIFFSLIFTVIRASKRKNRYWNDDEIYQDNDEEDDDDTDDYVGCISVYASNGELIKQFCGRFEIDEEDNGYVSFTDQNDKEYTIYTSGTIIIGDIAEYQENVSEY